MKARNNFYGVKGGDVIPNKQSKVYSQFKDRICVLFSFRAIMVITPRKVIPCDKVTVSRNRKYVGDLKLNVQFFSLE